MSRLITMAFAAGLLLTSSALASPSLASQAAADPGGSTVRAPVSPIQTHAYGPEASQFGTLRLPAGDGPFPVVALIHGGCWTKGYATLADIDAFGMALVEKGIAVWNIEYRQVGEAGAGWPGTFDDVTDAIDALAQLARNHPLDLDRVSLVGHSAGAHLAAYAASRKKAAGAENAVAGVSPVSLVMIDGPASLEPLVGPDAAICGQPVIIPLMGGSPAEHPDRYAQVSVASQLPLGLSQLLVIGELAPFMSPYMEAARLSGDPVSSLAPPGASHFELISPQTAAGRQVVDFVAANAFRD